MVTVLENAINFLNDLGVYNVILPFLLIFSIVFAILEKTKILGIEKIEGVEYTKRNLDAMVAFVAAFLVVGSSYLATAVNEIIGKVVMLLLLAVSYLLLVGVFFGTKEVTIADLEGWKKFFLVFMFVGIVLIFLDSLGWLASFINYISGNYRTDWVASLILIGVVIVFMVGITRTEEKKAS